MSSERSSSAIDNALTGLEVGRRWPLYLLEALCGAALILSALLDTERTSLAPEVLLVAVGVWLATSVVAAAWYRSGGGPVAPLFNPTTLFFAVAAATFTIHALDAVAPTPDEFVPSAPEAIHGLTTNFSPYYLVLFASTVLFLTWYARHRERETEAGIALAIVITSLAFETMLRKAGTQAAPFSGTLSIPLLWSVVLVLAALYWSNEARQGTGWRSTPFDGPILALLGAGALTMITSIYVHGTAIMLARLGAFAVLFWLAAQVTAHTRQLRLFWLAVVAPMVGVAVMILLKLTELYREMGLDFVLAHRYQISGVAGPNPQGLSIGLAIVFVVGALLVERRLAVRVAVGSLLVLLIPGFLAGHSPVGIVALGGSLVALLVVRHADPALRGGWRVIGPRSAALLAFAAVAVMLTVLVPNPYITKLRGDVEDPSTGKGARQIAWRFSARSFEENPIVGMGLNNYYGRTRYVDDLPSESMTLVSERRLLLGATVPPWKDYVSAHPHNVYLAILEGAGVFGLLALLWLGAALVWAGWRVLRRAEDSVEWWSTALALTGTSFVLVWGIVAQGADVAILGLPFWPLLGVLAGTLRMHDPEGKGRSVLPSSWRRYAARAGAVLARYVRGPQLGALALLVFAALVARPLAADILVTRVENVPVGEQPERSLNLVRWAHRLDPWNASYTQRLVERYLARPSLAQATATQKDLVRQRRYFAPDHVRLGWLYWMNNRPSAAFAEFAYAAELDSWDATGGNVYTALGIAQANSGRRGLAVETFARAFRLSPNIVDDDLWVTLPGEVPDRYLDPVFLQQPVLPANANEAAAGGDTAATTTPAVSPTATGGTPPGGQTTARPRGLIPQTLQRAILARLGQPTSKPAPGDPSIAPGLRLSRVLDVMESQYESASRRDPADAVRVLEDASGLALRIGMYARAERVLQTIARAAPEDSAAYYSLGLTYVALEEPTQARAAFERAIEVGEASGDFNLRVPFSHYQLGLLALHERPSDTATAARELRHALDEYRWDYFPNLYVYLAIAESLEGDREAAERDLDHELFLLGREGDLNALDAPAVETAGLTTR